MRCVVKKAALVLVSFGRGGVVGNENIPGIGMIPGMFRSYSDALPTIAGRRAFAVLATTTQQGTTTEGQKGGRGRLGNLQADVVDGEHAGTVEVVG